MSSSVYSYLHFSTKEEAQKVWNGLSIPVKDGEYPSDFIFNFEEELALAFFDNEKKIELETINYMPSQNFFQKIADKFNVDFKVDAFHTYDYFYIEYDYFYFANKPEFFKEVFSQEKADKNKKMEEETRIKNEMLEIEKKENEAINLLKTTNLSKEEIASKVGLPLDAITDLENRP